MKLRMLAAAAILTMTFAGTAIAEGRLTASLKAPVAAKTKVVADGSLFVCEGDACVASSAAGHAISVSSCKALVKKVGALSAYGDGRRAIEGDDLAACNAVAKG